MNVFRPLILKFLQNELWPLTYYSDEYNKDAKSRLITPPYPLFLYENIVGYVRMPMHSTRKHFFVQDDEVLQ
jgi:hypothetical protein